MTTFFNDCGLVALRLIEAGASLDRKSDDDEVTADLTRGIITQIKDSHGYVSKILRRLATSIIANLGNLAFKMFVVCKQRIARLCYKWDEANAFWRIVT